VIAFIVVSDEPTDATTLDAYGLRFDIEEAFLDEKSGGYQIHLSELATPEALERLLLILAIATVHWTSTGGSRVQAGKWRWVDAHWGRGLSYRHRLAGDGAGKRLNEDGRGFPLFGLILLPTPFLFSPARPRRHQQE